MSDSGKDVTSSERTDPAFYEALGRAIQVLRTDLKMSRRDLADASGLSYSYLSEIENGTKRSSSSALLKIADALGLQLNELIMAAEERVEPSGTLGDSVALMADEVPSFQLTAHSDGDIDDGVAFSQEARVEAPPTQTSLRRGRSFRRAYSSLGSHRSGPRDDREIRPLLAELLQILRRLDPEDRERLLDYARRLMR